MPVSGRMHYFMATIALAVVMTAICFAIASYFFQSAPGAMITPARLMKSWPTIAAMAFFGCMTFTLQSMRIRDIGWDPICVIPAWIAILIVDHIIAGRVQAWSLGHEHNGTIVGGLVNLGLVLALTFWPSSDHERPFNEAYRKPDKPSQKPDAASIAAGRIARATRAEFGGRTY